MASSDAPEATKGKNRLACSARTDTNRSMLQLASLAPRLQADGPSRNVLWTSRPAADLGAKVGAGMAAPSEQWQNNPKQRERASERRDLRGRRQEPPVRCPQPRTFQLYIRQSRKTGECGAARRDSGSARRHGARLHRASSDRSARLMRFSTALGYGPCCVWGSKRDTEHCKRRL